MHQDATWYGGRPQPRGLCVRWGPSPVPEKGTEPLIFGPCLLRPQTAAWIKMPFGMEVGLDPDDIVLNGDPAPPPQNGAELPLQVSANVSCGQTAGWIKMALGMEVGFSSGDFVLDGAPSPLPKKGGARLQFSAYAIAAKRLHGSRCHLLRR